MFQSIVRFLVLIAAVQILGGHWAVLQTVAWTGMLVDFAQRDSLAAAVTKTFDGAHPCSLCESVTEGRQQEKKQEAAIVVAKLDAVLAPALALPQPHVEMWPYAVGLISADARDFAPPTPPPRV